MRLLRTTSGGLGGGSSNLSPDGHEVVRRYQAVRAGRDELVLDRFQSAFPDLTM